MYKRFIEAFPPKRILRVDTLDYVFPNLAFEHQIAVIKVLMQADYRIINEPWVEAWMTKNYYKIVKLDPARFPNPWEKEQPCGVRHQPKRAANKRVSGKARRRE